MTSKPNNSDFLPALIFGCILWAAIAVIAFVGVIVGVIFFIFNVEVYFLLLAKWSEQHKRGRKKNA